MPLPCNNVSVTPIKVSQLVRYSNLDGDDLLLTVQSGSSLWSRRSTINDLKSSLGRLTGSYSGSFTGSFKGKSSGSFSGSYWGRILSKNTVATGSFSGSYWGRILSKNTVASGSFSGSHYGSLVSKNIKATGSFRGSIVSTNTVASGSFSGSHYGSLLSKNTKATGSFRGSIVSTNTVASGSFSGSYWGRILSKNTKATGSFSGSHYGSLISKNTKATGSFSGSHYGKVIGSNGSLITGSFRGIDNITNFKGTGKKVSFNGTASYAVSSSYALTASSLSLLGSGTGSPLAFAHASFGAAGSPNPAGLISSFNVNSVTLNASQPVSQDGNLTRTMTINFTTTAGTTSYGVVLYSFGIPAGLAESQNAKNVQQVTEVTSRNATNFIIKSTNLVISIDTPDDGDDEIGILNTSFFPTYTSFVVYK
jgi:hypothetical protein